MVATVDIPAETVERAVTAGLFISVRMTLNGKITSTVFSSTREIAQDATWMPSQIEDLVSNAVHPENLRMEDATATDLKSLLASLQRSVRFVKDALNQITERATLVAGANDKTR